MRKSVVSLVIVSVLGIGLSACANESTQGMTVAMPEFSGSFLAPSQAFTASATPSASATAKATVAGAAPDRFNKSKVAALATKVIEPPKEDVWSGPFCKKYKTYILFFDKQLSFNAPVSHLTTGDPLVKQAITQVKAMKPLAKDPAQVLWADAAVKFYSNVDSGKPYYWDQASPYTDSTGATWVDTNNAKDIKAVVDFADFAASYQALMSTCLKLK
ncbi:MAG: hypothetical protein EBS41_01655 [Actinobacteria bacterium]|nr:hypothetical protein [Actinomycetota bacterium]